VQIEIARTAALNDETRGELLALGVVAFDEDLTEHFAAAGPGVHLFGRVNGALVSHAMYVERTLEPAGMRPLRTAYVEVVATHPRVQGRGYASRLLRRLADEILEYEIGALAPSDPAFYARLGWELWRGPLGVRTTRGLIATPDEEAMVLRLPRTPRELNLDSALSIEWRPGEVW
jgi:aminoglycoside 2'-N-acetyltransferase I